MSASPKKQPMIGFIGDLLPSDSYRQIHYQVPFRRSMFLGHLAHPHASSYLAQCQLQLLHSHNLPYHLENQ